MRAAALSDRDVRLIGVEAGGHGLATGKHAASLNAGKPGVLHGNRTYLLQDEHGQVTEWGADGKARVLETA